MSDDRDKVVPLTKREQFVLAAMQGLCAALDYGQGKNFISDEDIAQDAVNIADCTLDELEHPTDDQLN